MIKAIQHNFTRSYEWTTAGQETGVECKADVVCLQEQPRERGGCGMRHSAYEIRKRQTVWTVIRKGNGLLVYERSH